MSNEQVDLQALVEQAALEEAGQTEHTEEVAQEQQELDPVLKAAMDKGYNPDREDFIARGGNPDDWVDDPKIYLDRGPFMKQIKNLNRKLDAVAAYNEQLMTRMAEAEKRGYEQALLELKKMEDIVYETQDPTKIRQYEKELAKVEQEAARAVAPPSAEDLAAKAFVQRNMAWWNVDADKTASAVRMWNDIKAQNPNIDPFDLCAEIDRRINAPVQQASVEQAKAAPKPSFVSPGGRTVSTHSGTSTPSYALGDLTSEAKQVFLGIQSAREAKGQKFSVADFVAEAKRCGVDGVLKG